MEPRIDSACERTCPDCERAVPEGAVFCPHCSQRIAISPLKLREIVTELFGTLATLELPILRTTRGLLIHPGRVASEWIVGKRQTYMNPFKFIVVVGLIVALTYPGLYEQKVEHMGRGQPIYEVGLAHHAIQYFAFFCIALLVPVAFVLRVLDRFFDLGRSWLDWYVLGLYTYGIAAALQLAIGVVRLVLPPGFAMTPLLFIESLLPAVLLLFGAVGFVERGRRARAFASALIAQVVVLLAFAGWQRWGP